MYRFYRDFTKVFTKASKFAVIDSIQTLTSTAIAYSVWTGYESFFAKPSELKQVIPSSIEPTNPPASTQKKP